MTDCKVIWNSESRVKDRNMTWNSKGQDLLVTDINGSPHDRLKCMIKPVCVHMHACLHTCICSTRWTVPNSWVKREKMMMSVKCYTVYTK